MNLPHKIGVRAALAGILALALAGCGSTDEAYVEKPVEELYSTAMKELADGDWPEAAKAFDEVERQHPYSTLAVKSQLMSAYALYKADKYDEAIAAADRYAKLHPGASDADYAYYLIALSYYEQITDVGRDQKLTEYALNSLGELVQRFPDSQYSKDARDKIETTRAHLAGKEMSVGRFYLQNKNYLAAINRFRTVVEKYQGTSHVPEALLRLMEAYLTLGVVTEAQTAAAVLEENYPETEWNKEARGLLSSNKLKPQVASESWMTRVWKKVF